MPQNVEIKAKVNNLEEFRQAAQTISDTPGELIIQKDTFFTVIQGRLKLRDFGDGQGQLIRYHRPDATGPKVSDYSISPTSDPECLTDLLSRVMPVLGVISKKRTLYLAGRTRIHLDDVEGLGWFMELEVVLKENETPADGEGETRILMEKLGINQEDLVEGAYLDMLLARG
jgi:adenylate cyclase class IV